MTRYRLFRLWILGRSGSVTESLQQGLMMKRPAVDRFSQLLDLRSRRCLEPAEQPEAVVHRDQCDDRSQRVSNPEH